MKAILEALLTIVVGIALLPVVRSFVTTASENASESEVTLLNLITIFWVLGILGVAAAMVYIGYKKGR